MPSSVAPGHETTVAAAAAPPPSTSVPLSSEEVSKGTAAPSSGMSAGASAAFEVGAHAACCRVKGSPPSSVEIIERVQNADGSWRYYVHYEGTDRRLDDWVEESALQAVDEGSATERVAPGLRGRSAPERRATRNMKRKIDETTNVLGQSYDEDLEREHAESTKLKNIKVVEIGLFEVDAWYFSPYPDAFGAVERLYICPFSLKYFKCRSAYVSHLGSSQPRQPPGEKIYSAPAPAQPEHCRALGLPAPARLTAYEVDGAKHKVYCQCLCLLAKLFLDHKTLYYDVEPFLFYVLCEEDAQGDETLAGYFSKEKSSAEGNNIACILVMPQHQRKGYGKLLIDLAYEITRREGKVGSPEKPLSDLGQLSFRSYWTEVLLEALRTHRGNCTVKDLAARTAVHADDIVSTLQSLNLIRFWKGQHVISVSPKIVDEHLRANSRQSLRCDPKLMTWQPPDMDAAALA